MQKAASLAEELLGQHKDKISEFSMVPSSGGVFEVTVGDKLIFSKKQLERFPEAGEVEKLFSENV